jgi:hypothetical protein
VSAAEASRDADEAVAKWVDWAKKKADWLDPIVTRRDDLLGEHEHDKDEKEKQLNEVYSSGGGNPPCLYSQAFGRKEVLVPPAGRSIEHCEYTNWKKLTPYACRSCSQILCSCTTWTNFPLGTICGGRTVRF